MGLAGEGLSCGAFARDVALLAAILIRDGKEDLHQTQDDEHDPGEHPDSGGD